MRSAAVRFGVLGTAHITPVALLRPARLLPGVDVVAIAARDEARATRFAARFGIPRVHRTYAELVEDPQVDAVYVPLPNSLHAEWAIHALQAGKHVLCEKPLASNAAEAMLMIAAAERAGRVLAEGLHWRYHPLADRMRAVVDSGVLGTVRHIDATLTTLRLHPADIRYRADLGGGAMMDLGCYGIDIVRHLAGAEPEVVSTSARLAPGGVDRWMRADLRFADGRTARVTCGLFSASLLRRTVHVACEAGDMRITNPLAPHLFNRLRIQSEAGGRRSAERVAGDSTYVLQLQAFVRAVRSDEGLPADAANGLANMRVIDEIYRQAGLPPRGR
jgi:predicted dehydrogenase